MTFYSEFKLFLNTLPLRCLNSSLFGNRNKDDEQEWFIKQKVLWIILEILEVLTHFKLAFVKKLNFQYSTVSRKRYIRGLYTLFLFSKRSIIEWIVRKLSKVRSCLILSKVTRNSEVVWSPWSEVFRVLVRYKNKFFIILLEQRWKILFMSPNFVCLWSFLIQLYYKKSNIVFNGIHVSSYSECPVNEYKP